MRAAVMLAFVLLASPFAARAQETQPVDLAALVSACADQVVLPAGVTAGPPAITAYCQCAIDRAEAALTPAEFTMFNRVALSRLGAGAPPSESDLAAVEHVDPVEFERRQQVLRVVIRAQCSPILLGPRGTTAD